MKKTQSSKKKMGQHKWKRWQTCFALERENTRHCKARTTISKVHQETRVISIPESGLPIPRKKVSFQLKLAKSKSKIK